MNKAIKVVLVVLGIIAVALVVFGVVKGSMFMISWASDNPLIALLLAPFAIGAISGLCSPVSDTDCYDDHSSSQTKTVEYEHRDLFGIPQGYTTVNGDKASHSNFWGIPEGSSERNGNTIQNNTWCGLHNGESKIKDDKIEYYGPIEEGYKYKGHSKILPNGDLDHFDEWGLPIGTSKKKQP